MEAVDKKCDRGEEKARLNRIGDICYGDVDR